VRLIGYIAAAALLALCVPCTASDLRADNGVWLRDGKPYYSTTAHAVFHKFREDRAGAIEDLKRLKAAGFTIVEVYWQWGKDLDPATNEFSFAVFDDFVLECKRIGLPTFCMFQEYVPIWLANKHGWTHTSEEGKPDVRVDDFYVHYPTYNVECKRFYDALLKHLKDRPEVSENVLYFNMGGEYKPFHPIRQARELHYGYDEPTVAAYRAWLKGKGWTLDSLAERWGATVGSYKTWDDVWPAVNLKRTDYEGRQLARWGQAFWDWFEFRQDASWRHVADTVKWIRAAGDKRPLIHEYNTVTPGGIPLFLDWAMVGARPDKDGIYLSTGSFDREFDFNSVLYNLAIARGASAPPWQSNEQGGMTTPEWMRRHAWFMIGMGGTGLHFWEWRGDGWGLVNGDGTPKDGLAQATQLNAQFDYLGDLFQGSKPMPNRIGVLLLAEETLFAPRMHDREVGLILRALLDLGSGSEVAIITDANVLHGGLSDYRMIIVPGQARMRQSVREKLAEFVRGGGVLWLTPGSVSKSEGDATLSANPGAPLDRVAGLTVGDERQPVIGEMSLGKPHQAPPVAVLDRSAFATTARPIGLVGGEGALWRNSFGKGACYYQAAHTAYLPGGDTPLLRDPAGLASYIRANAGQLPLDALSRALMDAGIEPYASVHKWIEYSPEQIRDMREGRTQATAPYYPPLSTVQVGIRRAESGYLLFLIEGDNRTHDALVRLNLRRLKLNGKLAAYCPLTLERIAVNADGTMRMRITPGETKIVHILSEPRAGKWMAWFRQRNWPARLAKLPPVPEKKLIPPSEIGRVDPGDLAAVRPEPYGDKWLLVDISKHVNRSLVDEGKMENAKAFLGSVGTGDNDLQELPVGTREFVGVPFKVLDPKTNRASCMITKTTGRPWLGPLEFKGIPVRENVKRIHWLYGSGWAPFDLPVAYITYNYSDGSREQENVICGRNVMNWWGRAQDYENEKLKLAWAGSTPAAARNFTTVGLYHYAWENPHPDRTLESIDITSYGGDACLIVVALTGER
jgi:hypothetical protein